MKKNTIHIYTPPCWKFQKGKIQSNKSSYQFPHSALFVMKVAPNVQKRLFYVLSKFEPRGSAGFGVVIAFVSSLISNKFGNQGSTLCTQFCFPCCISFTQYTDRVTLPPVQFSARATGWLWCCNHFCSFDEDEINAPTSSIIVRPVLLGQVQGLYTV